MIGQVKNPLIFDLSANVLYLLWKWRRVSLFAPERRYLLWKVDHLLYEDLEMFFNCTHRKESLETESAFRLAFIETMLKEKCHSRNRNLDDQIKGESNLRPQDKCNPELIQRSCLNSIVTNPNMWLIECTLEWIHSSINSLRPLCLWYPLCLWAGDKQACIHGPGTYPEIFANIVGF